MARLWILACAVLLVLTGCGGAGPHAHAVTPSGGERTAVLHAVKNAFFTSTGDSPNLRLTGLDEVAMGSTDWARATFGATPNAPAATRAALAGGHDEGLLSRTEGGAWEWLGYLAPGRATCRTAGRSIPGQVAHLLGLPAVCASVPTPSVSPLAAPGEGVADTTLTGGDQATLLSIFVTTKNSGPTGQVITPTTIMVSTTAPPRAAMVPGGEWAVVTYSPAAGAPEPLTGMQLQNGAGTAFFFRPAGRSWVLRAFAGQPYCNGARTAQVPPAVLTLWGHPC